jgi:hypothetical protein
VPAVNAIRGEWVTAVVLCRGRGPVVGRGHQLVGRSEHQWGAGGRVLGGAAAVVEWCPIDLNWGNGALQSGGRVGRAHAARG